MPLVPPIWILLLAGLVTMAALGWSWLQRRRRNGGLRQLALSTSGEALSASPPQWAQQLAPHLPVGAADVRVSDVVLGAAIEPRRAVARVDYSLGSVGHRRNNTRIAAFDVASDGTLHRLQLSPPGEDLKAQYARMLQ